MAKLIGTPMAVVGAITDIDTAARNPLGTRIKDDEGNEYIYLKGVASTVAGDWVSFDELFVTTRLVADAQGRVGIAQAATVATDFGWYWIYGTGLGNVLTGFADNGNCYCTSTAGSVDDTIVAGDLVVGAVGRSAVSNGQSTIELNYPFVTNVLPISTS